MKKTLATLFCLLSMTLMTSCGADAAASAAGVYELDTSAVKKAMEAELANASEAEKAMAPTMMKMFDSMKMSMELKADGTAEMKSSGPMGDQTDTGTWKIDGNKISMTAKGSDGKDETKTGTLEGGVITVNEEMGPGKTMKLMLRKK
ncbi:MAG: lipocalin family protein [Planctomycetota bacterium]